MNDSIKRISLDLHATGSRETVKVKRSDTGRKIHVSLVDGGKPYHISDDCYAVFTGKKPDGNILFNDCTIEGNVIIYKLTEQTAAVPGLVKCEIKLYGADDQLITSPKFSIMVDDTVYNEGDEIESRGEVAALTALVSDAIEAISDANTASSNANNIAQELRTARENGEFKGEKGPPGDPGAGLSTEAVSLLLTILSEALYISDQSGNIQKLKEALEKGATDEPEVKKLATPQIRLVSKLDAPVIRLETEDEPSEPADPEATTPAILGVAVLGRTILGSYGSSLPKLSKPDIKIVTEEEPEPEAPVLDQLDKPEIQIVTLKLATPTIKLETEE